MKKKLLISINLVVALLLLDACGKNDTVENTPDDLYTSFDRKGMLTNQADNLIIPSFNHFLELTATLQASADNYTNSPTETSLEELQNEWKNTYLILKQCELFQFGAVDNGFYWSKLDFWPVREVSVNDFINENELFDSEILATKGSTLKGMPVIEYLIFDNNTGNSKILNDFTIDEIASKRKSYLKGLCANLKGEAEKILAEWQVNYRFTYMNNDAQGISGSINLTVNNMIQTINYIKDMKVGKPFGKKDGILYPEEVEAFYSNQSIAAITNNLNGFENLFLGKSGSGNDGLGYDDFLNHLGAKSGDGMLSDGIKGQITDCRNKLADIEMPLQEAIVEQPEKVEAAYLSLKKLLILTQVDMVNNLGVTLTFTDNDGD